MAFNNSMRRMQFDGAPNSPSSVYSKMTARDFDLSVTMSPNDISAITKSRAFNDTTLRHVLDSTSIAGLELKASKEVDDLSEVFYEVLQSSNSSDVLEMIGRFAQSCCDSLEKINPWERFVPKNSWLSEEADTWRLLYCLYLDSIQGIETPAPLKEYEKLSPRKLISDLFQSDAELRLMQLIVDWLENCAAYHDSAIPSASRTGGTVHWENTLHHLENGMSLFDAESAATFVTELDPDAPRRQKKTLHPLDQEDEKTLCQSIFKELRCGRFEEAVSLCISAGQMWRAIILRGHVLLHYPEPPKIDATFPMVGNPSRDLWKWSCLGLLTETEENTYFRATLGVLCGHLPSLLTVCSASREDLLWAHLRVQIELRVDQFLKEHHTTALLFGSDQNLLQQFEQPTELSLHRIFGCVNALHKTKFETYYQEMQRHLMLEQVNSMLRKAAEWVGTADFNFIRFLAHIILVLRRVGKDPVEDVSDNILKAYVEKLIEKVDGATISPELIAYYTSTLPMKYQVEKYSQLMWLVEAKDDRARVMESGKQAGLDVEAAARETVKYAVKILKERSPNDPDNDSTMIGGTEENDQQLMQRVAGCLEWFSFYPSQIAVAVQMSNAIIRTLIFKGDADSATGVLSRLLQFSPPNAISKNLTSTSNDLREHMCLKAYLEAINGYATWYRQHVGGRPKSPEPLPNNYSFTDKVHYEQIKAQAAAQQERWTAAGLHQARHTKQLLYNVLLFPRGWLADDITSDEQPADYNEEESAEREKELLALRKLCIPEIVLLLLKILQGGNVDGHTEAVRLSEIIASEVYQLYKLFSKHKLREVLHKISDSSLSMLESNRDPWAFEINE